MANEATAKVVLEVDGAQELTDLFNGLTQMSGQLNGQTVNVGTGMPGAPASNGAPHSGAGTPASPPPGPPAPVSAAAANPGAMPHAMPQNAAPPGQAGAMGMGMGMGSPMFGTWNGTGFTGLTYDPVAQHFYDPATGTYMVGGGGFGMGGGKRAAPPKPHEEGFGSMAMELVAGWQMQMAVQQAGEQWGQAMAGGQKFYWERLTPAAMTLAGAGFGAAAGSVFPGLGTAVGMGLGATVGYLASTPLGPTIERRINEQEMRNLATNTGFIGDHDVDWKGLSSDMIERLNKSLQTGRYLPKAVSDAITDAHPEEPAVRKLQADFLEQAMYSTGNVVARGLPRPGDPALSVRDERDIAKRYGYGHELETSQYLQSIGLPHQADEMRGQYRDRTILEGRLEVAGADVGLEGSILQMAARYGGSAAARSALPGAQAATAQQVALMRQQANMMRSSDPYKAAALDKQAQQLEVEARAMPEAVFGAEEGEIQSQSALATGRAGRGFEQALYSGASADTLPWAARSSAAVSQARRLTRLMAERKRAGMLSPEMEADMREEIEGLQEQAKVGIPHEREQMHNQELQSRTSLATATRMSGAIPGILRGSAEGQVREMDIQLEGLQKQQQTLEAILATSKYLTQEQRLQMQTQVESLKTEEARLQVAAVIARSEARETTFGTSQTERRSAYSIAAIRGQEPGAATATSVAGFRADLADVQFFNSEADRLKRDEHLDENNPRIQDLRRKAAGAQVQSESDRANLASVDYSPSQRVQSSTLQTALSISQMGYGTFGDVRMNLRAQADLSATHVRDIDRRKAALKAQGIEITPEMEARFAEERNQAVLQTAQLAQEYNEGWDQRLISEAYGMPSQGRLFMSRFTHREAAMAGIVHRSFGGDLEQTTQMRMLYPRMMAALGSGSPSGENAHLLAGGRETTIHIKLTVDDKGGRVRDTQYQITGNKTGTDFTVNTSGQARKPG